MLKGRNLFDRKEILMKNLMNYYIDVYIGKI